MTDLLPRAFLLAAIASYSAQAQTGAQNHSSWQPDISNPADYLARLGEPPISITDSGARPDDGKDDTRPILNAIKTANRLGRKTLYVPTGRFEISESIPLPSGMAVIGSGCDQSRIVRRKDFVGQVMFWVAGTQGVRVQGLSFEYNDGVPYTAGIALRGAGSSNLVILDNCFSDVSTRRSGGDRMAVGLGAETSPSARIWIGRNKVDGDLQLTAGGGLGISELRILDNYIQGSSNAGIAVTTGASGVTFRDVQIARNIINNTFGLGIYVGPDIPSALQGTFENVSITENRISGFRAQYATAIYLRAAERLSSGYTISGNQLDAGSGTERVAIRMEDNHGGGVRRFTNILIENNVARSFERGIWLAAVDGALLKGNDIDGSRAYLIDPSENWNIVVQN